MRILFVEDEPAVASFVKQGLEEEGYAVDIARTGPEGESRALSGRYDLVILDLMLPGKNGLEVCRSFRESDRLVPILILSARDRLEDKITGLEAGADDYLTKPFAFEELLARVRAQLRRASTAEPLQVRAGPLVLDRAKRVARLDDRECVLTNKEFSLLACLLTHAGEVMSRAAIAEELWGADFPPESNVIDVLVNHLRRKLDRAFSVQLIQTVRGLGYTVSSGTEMTRPPPTR